MHQDAVIGKLREAKPAYSFSKCTHINDESIVLLVKYKTFDYLVSGDLGGTKNSGQSDFETPVITALQLSPLPELQTATGGIDVLHLGHHGSKTSSNQTYIDQAGSTAWEISIPSTE